MSAPRRTSPRRRYNPYYHQMGDHTLFHNGSTARMFPALSRLPPDRLSELFHVPPADKIAERYDEVRFSEPYQSYQMARLSFRPLDSPTRDEQQNKIVSLRGGGSGVGSDGGREVAPPVGFSERLEGYSIGTRRRGADGNNINSNRNNTDGADHLDETDETHAARTAERLRPSTAGSASAFVGASRSPSHQQRQGGDYSLTVVAGTPQRSGNRPYVSKTIRIHGGARFKVATPAEAKTAIKNTIPSLNIGFDVDETLHQAKLAEAEEHKYKQCVISSRIPTAPRSSRREPGGGASATASSTSSPSHAGGRGWRVGRSRSQSSDDEAAGDDEDTKYEKEDEESSLPERRNEAGRVADGERGGKPNVTGAAAQRPLTSPSSRAPTSLNSLSRSPVDSGGRRKVKTAASPSQATSFPLVYRPFSRGTVADAQKRLGTNWYLNNRPNPLQEAIAREKEQRRRERELERERQQNNTKVVTTRHGSSRSNSTHKGGTLSSSVPSASHNGLAAGGGRLAHVRGDF